MLGALINHEAGIKLRQASAQDQDKQPSFYNNILIKMGVSGLWDILKDAKTVTRIENMSGQTLAVDLAVWVCEADGVKPMHDHVQKPYLRNLFFRVTAAIKAGIKLVFVLDGKAPDLKLDTIVNRIAARGGAGSKSANGVRRRLNARFNECCRLLDGLGVPWVKAQGEAEAFCAALNKSGLVDAVITNDGDCFLYGARTVYRNFSVDKKDTSMECYLMEDIERTLHLDQRGLIALGLLLGCDYCPKGVMGVGTVQATNLLANLKGQDPLHVFQSWRETSACGNTTGVTGLKKCSPCSSCKCTVSKKSKWDTFTACACQCHVVEKKKSRHALEEKVKSLALKDPSFPDKNIISEFLSVKRYENQDRSVDLSADNRLKRRFTARSPMLDITCRYLVHSLGWKLSYSVEKVLPLLTLSHLRSKHDQKSNEDPAMQIKLDRIVKQRIKDRIPSFEIKWTLVGHSGDFADEEEDIEMVTIESEEEVKRMYPSAIAEYFKRKEQEKADKKKEKEDARKLQRRKKKAENSFPLKQAQDETRKVTDFFDTKLPPVHMRKESKLPPKCTKHMDELGFSLASLSLQVEKSNAKTAAGISAENPSPQPGSSKCLDSSSNPSSCLNETDLNIASNAGKLLSDTDCDTQAQEKDITFSGQLDFSLDFFKQSLTPQRVVADKENLRHSSNPLAAETKSDKRGTKTKVLCQSDLTLSETDALPGAQRHTPQKSSLQDLAVASADSPVFMTLMERLKLRARLKNEGL